VPQPFPVHTPAAYAWWDEEGSTAKVRLDDAVNAVRHGDARDLAGWLWNDLQGPVARRHAQIQVVVERLLDLGALGAVMSGSGPTVAGLVRDEREAERIAERIPGAVAVSAPPPPEPTPASDHARTGEEPRPPEPEPPKPLPGPG